MGLGLALRRVIVCFAFKPRIYTSLMDGETECGYCFNLAHPVGTQYVAGERLWLPRSNSFVGPSARTHAPVVVSIADLIQPQF